MSTWINKYSCPVFMFVPRTPWPFANEYYSIGSGISNSMFGIELAEGEDWPPENILEFDQSQKSCRYFLAILLAVRNTS